MNIQSSPSTSTAGGGSDTPHALVIGSGFGGLAAAVRLGARGYRVTVLERRDQPGGRAYVYRQDGFTFDGGPTVITAPFLLEELWELCGKRMADTIDMRPVSPFYRVRFHDGEVFDYQGDAEVMREQIRKFNPDDVEHYERFLRMSEQIFEVGFERLSHVPFGSILDMLKITPAMIRLQSYRTVYNLVARFIEDERLRQVFSFHPLLVGGNPFKTTSIYTLIAFLERKWGVFFPIGGTGTLIRGLVELVEGQGGEVRLETEVEEVLVEQGRAAGVRLKSGERIDADIVVSNADSAYLYKHLLPARYRKRWTDKKLERVRYSMSLFVWYFGTKRKYEDVAHHTILLGPRYKGLLDDIFERKVLAEDFSLYLHRPTATDPALAPAGCDAFYVLSPVPHLDSGTDWEAERERYRAKICAYLSSTIMPGLEDELASSHVLDPLGFERELLSHKGAAFGVEPVLTQSAYFRPHNESEEIEGLYLVGAGTHPGAGVPGVLSSAKVLDKVVPHADALVHRSARSAQ
ncbi:phytoene desaturase [Enhygromyxa salina]|uniref:phytoene desaturase n=1 Tax=Enhygromyxa salina TaxID=215803 RepID=UPI002159A1CD|nr:phytoene desaturase [Enhygromyxa salina]